MKITVIGGGAAGFFSALTAKKENPSAEVLLLERSAQLLNKVRISGGGRCNVTHSCFDPKELVKNYPRGHKELLGPFHRFQPLDTINWFENRGISLKTEEDGRMFPTTNSSQTIIDCFLQEANQLGVKIHTNAKVKGIKKVENFFHIDIGESTPLVTDRVILATGSARAGWDFASLLGHSIQPAAPSLFTLKISSFPFTEIAGVSVNPIVISLDKGRLKQKGPLLLTHWGFSGPAALKLSAWAAKFLAEKSYNAPVKIDWLPDYTPEEVKQMIHDECKSRPAKQVYGIQIFPIPKSLWRELCKRSELPSDFTLRQLSKASIAKLCETLKSDKYTINGKTTNKEEFVTCGGITLSEIQFKNMESKICPGLFLCGEILNIDGVTGGFNFQNAWTTGWIAGKAAAE
ncbi:MAG: NAD(P)/FAD-dependent oxidoreductase [Chlamydiota bacterium]|nr:NAD(P)/FAD-dependent oxidoreductase [Chlamydiota bacterium]